MENPYQKSVRRGENLIYRVLIIGFLFFSVTMRALAVPYTSPCQQLLLEATRIQELDRVFSTVFCQKGVYKFQMCHSNVIRLYQEFKKLVPHVEPQEFRVLYITTERWRNDFFDDVGFHVNRARGGFVKGEFERFLVWRFHVVLEYRGRIYDLDFNNQAKPVEKKQYLHEFFVTHQLIEQYRGELVGPPDELSVLVVPGEEYLNHSDSKVAEMGFHQELVTKYPPQALVDYLLSPR